jgi:AhpD family alkylhydroperoxidase
MWLKFENSQLPLLTRIILFFQRKKFGFDLNPTKAWGVVPRLMLGMNFFFKLIASKSSKIDVSLRTLISVKISQINNCEFCIDMNSHLFFESKGETEKIKQLKNWLVSNVYSSKEKVALEYAETITITGRSVSKELQAKLLEHFKKEEIIELTAIIAYQNLSSKFNSALDIKPNGFCEIDKSK